MESKTFLGIIIGTQALIILIGIYFIGAYSSTQEYTQFKENQLQADQRFNQSQTNHGKQTGVIVEQISHLNERLDPILDQVPNATQSRIDQEIHYNQTTEDFAKIQQVLQIKLQDHVTLGQVNQTVNHIYDLLLNITGAEREPVVQNDTSIQNITDVKPIVQVENKTVLPNNS